MAKHPTIKLNTGAEIPAVGLGTWRSEKGVVAKAVETALRDHGYRHIDCAWAYGNEAEVGQGLVASGVRRSEVFITSKIWSTFHSRVEAGLDETLKNLGVDYVDLLLVHWPVALKSESGQQIPIGPDGERDVDFDWDIQDTWKQMEEVYKKGKAKAIGVSNYSVKRLEELLSVAAVVPAANQVELHPYLPQKDLVDYCKSKGIVMEAYSPLGSNDSPLLTEPEVVSIANKHSASPGQVLISWSVKRGFVVLPKSVTPHRIEENAKLVDLDEADVAKLEGFAKEKGGVKRFVHPPWGPKVYMGFEDWDQCESQL